MRSWFKFWISLSCTWIPFLPDQKDKKVVGGNFYFYTVSYKRWGAFLLFCTWHSWESKCHGLRWIPTWLIQERLCVHIMNDWVDRVSVTNPPNSQNHPQEKKDGEKKRCLHATHLLTFRLLYLLLFLQTILDFAACLGWSQGWLKKNKKKHIYTAYTKMPEPSGRWLEV